MTLYTVSLTIQDIDADSPEDAARAYGQTLRDWPGFEPVALTVRHDDACRTVTTVQIDPESLEPVRHAEA
jgi:hypothetical protein